MNTLNQTRTILQVDIDGRLATWDGDAFRGDAQVVEAAELAVGNELVVDIFGFFPVRASRNDPIGALAALSAHNPGRVFITQSPARVISWLDEAFAQRACSGGE